MYRRRNGKSADSVDAVAAVVSAKREILLRAQRHLANALEQKFRSRIADRRRALAVRGELPNAAVGPG